jgi:hypothetical protein
MAGPEAGHDAGWGLSFGCGPQPRCALRIDFVLYRIIVGCDGILIRRSRFSFKRNVPCN